ncbi:MAG: hypothetical protein ACQUHE_19365 [Bacteroidia bacterium]
MGARVHELIEKLRNTSEQDPRNSESEAFRIISSLSSFPKRAISTDTFSDYEKVFPGYSVEAYNLIVPSLVKAGWLNSKQLDFRDGPVIELAQKSIDLLKSINNGHSKKSA